MNIWRGRDPRASWQHQTQAKTYTRTCEVASLAAGVLVGLGRVAVDQLLLRYRDDLAGVHGIDALCNARGGKGPAAAALQGGQAGYSARQLAIATYCTHYNRQMMVAVHQSKGHGSGIAVAATFAQLGHEQRLVPLW